MTQAPEPVRRAPAPPAARNPKLPGAGPGAGGSYMPPRRTWLWFAVALLVNFLAVRLFMPGAETPLTVPYTLFKEEVAKRNVQSIYSRGETLSGRFVAPVTFPPANEAQGRSASTSARACARCGNSPGATGRPSCRPAHYRGTAIGAPVTGSGMTRAERPNAAFRFSSVSTACGVPVETRPSGPSSTRWSEKRAARLRSCRTATWR